LQLSAYLLVPVRVAVPSEKRMQLTFVLLHPFFGVIDFMSFGFIGGD